MLDGKGLSCAVDNMQESTVTTIGMAKLHYTLLKTLVFVGMMGSGKTAVGRAVASILDVPFIDTDAEIEASAGMTIFQIFETYGEEYFRKTETRFLARLLQGSPCALSIGGGGFLSAENREIIERHGVSIWLKVDLDLLWNRVRHKSTRPLLQSDDPLTTLRRMLAARTPEYAKARVWVLGQAGLSVPEMASRVIETLIESPVAHEAISGQST